MSSTSCRHIAYEARYCSTLSWCLYELEELEELPIYLFQLENTLTLESCAIFLCKCAYVIIAPVSLLLIDVNAVRTTPGELYPTTNPILTTSSQVK